MKNMDSEFNSRIQSVLADYEDKSNVLFQYLAERAKVNWTPAQFIVYRDNYFFRTYETIECVAKVIISAKRHEDYITLRSAGSNCYEESGSNIAHKSHPELLLYSHNNHSERIFGVKGISLSESATSPNILEETREFRKIQKALYESSNHIEVLAVNYAQEEAAKAMLQIFREAFFEPYRHSYSNKEFNDITEYFSCHLNGLEERHADEAKYCLFKRCNTAKDLEIAVASISKILSAQRKMWMAWRKKLQSLEDLINSSNIYG